VHRLTCLPFAAGWALDGTLHAILALVWAGLVRISFLQHITWRVNSLCHVSGRRPFQTRRHDLATNLWPVALLSFGESWHNMHHSDPACARHGADSHQVDIAITLTALRIAVASTPATATLTAGVRCPRSGQPRPARCTGQDRPAWAARRGAAGTRSRPRGGLG
jgi:fatty-acid desaturase